MERNKQRFLKCPVKKKLETVVSGSGLILIKKTGDIVTMKIYSNGNKDIKLGLDYASTNSSRGNNNSALAILKRNLGSNSYTKRDETIEDHSINDNENKCDIRKRIR